jgi:CBS domain-containing protein
MTISKILADGGREVASIEPAATLKSAATLLAEKRIGAVIILGADRRIVGILSERDIVRAIGERGAAALDEPVSQTMTRKVSTCTEGETLVSIMEQMTEGKFRHVPVVDQGRLTGIVSIGDVANIASRRWSTIPRRCATIFSQPSVAVAAITRECAAFPGLPFHAEPSRYRA